MGASRNQHTGVSAEPRSSAAGRPGWFARRRRYGFALRHAAIAPGARVVDVGGGDGSFGVMLLAAGAARVTVVDRRDVGDAGRGDRRLRLVHDDLLSRLDLLAEADAVCALHCLHQLGPDVHRLFRAIEDSPASVVVIQGSMSQEAWVAPEHEQEICGPLVGLPRGMIRLLEAHGFAARLHVHRRHPVAVGLR